MPRPSIVVVGAPNVGKSTLFNRLLGRRRALVHAEPGMTRDLNEADCRWEGRLVTLVDTGGLFAPGDGFLRDAVRRGVLAAARQASVLVFVVDGRRGPGPIDEDLARIFRSTGRPLVLVVNKLDDPAAADPDPEFHRLGFDNIVAISAEHGLGIGELRERVSALLPGGGDEAEGAEGAGEIRIAIAGRPNVGKSSLLNALIGDERSIVSEVPGTTRDAVDSILIRGGRSYRIVDTAGIRRPGRLSGKPEELSVMTARRSIEGSDVALLVMDATEAPTLQDLHVAGIAHEALRPFVVLLNKWDLIQARGAAAGGAAEAEDLVTRVRGRLRFAPHAPVITISARTGLRVASILPTVGRVHGQAMARIGTGRLNHWLRKAVSAHRPPASKGRDLKLYYISQKGTNPPAFVVFTNTSGRPHFSYQRYLQNSLRETFDLSLTPVSFEYRERPRREAVFEAAPRKGRKRPV